MQPKIRVVDCYNRWQNLLLLMINAKPPFNWIFVQLYVGRSVCLSVQLLRYILYCTHSSVYFFFFGFSAASCAIAGFFIHMFFFFLVNFFNLVLVSERFSMCLFAFVWVIGQFFNTFCFCSFASFFGQDDIQHFTSLVGLVWCIALASFFFMFDCLYFFYISTLCFFLFYIRLKYLNFLLLVFNEKNTYFCLLNTISKDWV